MEGEKMVITGLGMVKNRFDEIPDLWTQWGKERVGRIERVALKHNIARVKLDSRWKFAV